MGRGAEIPSAACNQLQVVAKMRGRVDHGAFPQCHAPRTMSCRYLRAGFADAVPVTHNATDDSGLMAYISLHEQWASNWGGEVAFSARRWEQVTPTRRRSHLPASARAALLFDAGAPHAWHLPTRHAQPVDLRARPAPLAFPAETGVAELLQIAFVCEKQHTDVPHLLPRMPPRSSTWRHALDALPSGGANLAYGAHERLMLFDQAWPESAQRWLSELATQATQLRSQRRRERSDRRSLRYRRDSSDAGGRERRFRPAATCRANQREPRLPRAPVAARLLEPAELRRHERTSSRRRRGDAGRRGVHSSALSACSMGYVVARPHGLPHP